MEAWSGCRRKAASTPWGLLGILRRTPSRILRLVGSDTVGNSLRHGAGDTGVEWETEMFGRESKWCSAGEEMAERVSIRDDMTSVDAGLTWT